MRSASILGAKRINRRIVRFFGEELILPRNQSVAVPAAALALTHMEVVRAEVVVAVCLSAAVDGLEELDLFLSRDVEASTVLFYSKLSFNAVLIFVICIRTFSSNICIFASGFLHVFELASGGRARLVLFFVHAM